MTTWVLVLFLKVGMMSNREAYSMATVEGFKSAGSCETAGRVAVSRLATGHADGSFACVEVR